MRVNIAVLNYNGKDLLGECLPSIIDAARRSRFNPKVTVLDNRSTDKSVEFLKKEFPEINIYIAKENKVYCSYNEFFQQADDDIILIFNSDIKVDKGFLDPMIEHFEKDKTVFFVSSRMYFFDGVTYQGDRAKAKVRFGIICAETRFKGYKALIEKAGYAFSTGNGAFDRKKFLELEGFDSIYLPGRYEDVDLCFRAWKAGYKGIYEPKSIIYHKGYGSFKAVFRDKQIYMVVFRNSLLFTWKNVLDFRILLSFYFWLPLRMAFFIITGRLFFLRGLWRALLRLPVVAQRRKAALKKFKLSDRDILRLVG